MRKYLYRLIIVVLVLKSLYTPIEAFSQKKVVYDSIMIASIQDSVDRYIQKHPRAFKPQQNRFKITPVIGFTYSEENKLGAIAGIDGYYRNSIDTVAPLSRISLTTGITTNLSFFAKIKGIGYSALGKFVIDYSFNIFSHSRLFWGLGYNETTISNTPSNFKLEGINLDTDFLYRPSENILIGPTIGFDYYSSKEFSAPEYIEGNPLYSRDLKIGIRFDYDSRDHPISPESGSFIRVEQIFYQGIAFNSKAYYKTMLTYDLFLRGWEGGVFALDLFADLNYGDTPWTIWPLMGGENRMRGYYQGRFRDRNYITAQLEIRQKIYKGHGIVIWGGVGNLFSSFNEFNVGHTLPTYGAGYRFEFAGIMLRADIGFGKPGSYAYIVSLNHAF